jgi:hypothetical protein
MFKKEVISQRQLKALKRHFLYFIGPKLSPEMKIMTLLLPIRARFSTGQKVQEKKTKV